MPWKQILSAAVLAASIVAAGSAGAQSIVKVGMVMPMTGGTSRLIAQDRIPADFPAAQLVTPRKVVFRSPDGLEIHGQLFERADLAAHRALRQVQLRGSGREALQARGRFEGAQQGRRRKKAAGQAHGSFYFGMNSDRIVV